MKIPFLQFVLLALILLVCRCFAQAPNCAQPNYPCTMHQTAGQLTVIPLPSPVPDIGNLTGANRVVTMPVYNTKILRCTDVNTSVETSGLHSYEVTDSGGSSDIQWNANGHMLRVVYMTTGTTRVVQFNPTTFTCSKAIPGSQSPTGNVWSNVRPEIDYFLKGTKVYRRTFSGMNPPASVFYFDWTVACPTLPASSTIKWKSGMWLNADDSIMALAFSDRGGQNSGEWLAMYQPATKGCQTWNTLTGVITAHGFGVSGKPTTFYPFTIHDVEMGFGSVMHVALGDTCTGCPVGSGFLYKAGGLEANWIGKLYGGHNNIGYTKYINSENGVDYAQRQWTTPDVVSIIDKASVSLPLPAETHVSWKNDNPTDTMPFMVGTSSQDQAQPLVISSPLEQENVLINFDGTFSRVAPTMVSGVTNAYNFRTANAIGSISQQGYYAWSSDWEGTLGNMDGKTATCKLGTLKPTACRSDVFVVIPQ